MVRLDLDFRFLAQSSLRLRDKSSGGTVGFYVHIPIGVRDGRDAILLLKAQFTIALSMGQHNEHENGSLNPRNVVRPTYLKVNSGVPNTLEESPILHYAHTCYIYHKRSLGKIVLSFSKIGKKSVSLVDCRRASERALAVKLDKTCWQLRVKRERVGVLMCGEGWGYFVKTSGRKSDCLNLKRRVVEAPSFRQVKINNVRLKKRARVSVEGGLLLFEDMFLIPGPPWHI